MQREIIIDNLSSVAGDVFGNLDENVAVIEDAFNVSIILRDGVVIIEGLGTGDVNHAANVLASVTEVALAKEVVTRQLVAYYCDMEAENKIVKAGSYNSDAVCLNAKGAPIKPKTRGQVTYVEAITKSTITFGVGPAGTGKTYLAVAQAVAALRKDEVSRIILTRPAVEAGEKLGFLPGDLQNKVDPYLRPLYDALYDIFGFESFQKNLEKGTIEIAPLAYMRGRTLDNAFIILDEAQNTTQEQMKMFLTRIGNGSKAVVNGDITQIDLPPMTPSGLKSAQRILKDIDGIEFVNFSEKDVVRHELVKKIIKAYAKFDEERAEAKKKEKGKKT